jgi:hypothetical protein
MSSTVRRHRFWLAIVGALLPGQPASALTPEFVEAFIRVSEHPTERQAAVESQMDDFVSLESIVREGLIQSVYDCSPELRTSCFEALANVARGSPAETVVQEWGEWWDLDAETRAGVISEHFKAAAALGFNLLSNDELSAPP